MHQKRDKGDTQWRLVCDVMPEVRQMNWCWIALLYLLTCSHPQPFSQNQNLKYTTLGLPEHLHVFAESGDPTDEEHHVEPGGEAADAGRVVLPPTDVQLTSLKSKSLMFFTPFGHGRFLDPYFLVH